MADFFIRFPFIMDLLYHFSNKNQIAIFLISARKITQTMQDRHSCRKRLEIAS
jgi:hypothetical protein